LNLYTIIVTFNGSEWIKQSIKSLVDSNFKTNIIIIDNGSTDGTQNIIKSYSSIKFIESKTNFGFGKANNIGLKIALDNDADYIFLLNQDACVEVDTIGNLVEVMESDKKIGIVSPIHLNGSGKALDKLFSTYVAPVLTNNPCLFMSDSYTQQLAEYYEVDFVNAAAWLLSRECIEKVGEFDSLFYHYGEDVNYCQRLKYYDYKLAIVPNSKIFHDRENRIIKKDKSMEFKKRSLLIELCDINKSENYIKARILYLNKIYRRKIVVDLFKGRLHLIKDSMEIIKFINMNKSLIIKSRKKNIQEGN
jgi:GT2 family glycosyltransferase